MPDPITLHIIGITAVAVIATLALVDLAVAVRYLGRHRAADTPVQHEGWEHRLAELAALRDLADASTGRHIHPDEAVDTGALPRHGGPWMDAPTVQQPAVPAAPTWATDATRVHEAVRA